MFAAECIAQSLLLLLLQVAGHSLCCALVSTTTQLLTVNHFMIHYNTSPHHIQYKSLSYNSDVITGGAVPRDSDIITGEAVPRGKGVFVIRYSPGGRLIAIAINNRRLSRSKILFLSPSCAITTSVSPYKDSYEHGRYRLFI